MAKITMQDLAERLGVSRFTVSRALSGGSGVTGKEDGGAIRIYSRKFGSI